MNGQLEEGNCGLPSFPEANHGPDDGFHRCMRMLSGLIKKNIDAIPVPGR